VVEAQGQVASRREREERSNALLRETFDQVKDLMTPRSAIYWSDLGASALLGYGGFAVAVLATSPWVTGAALVVSIMALYRGVSFIHELTHIRSGSVPGFVWGWNAVIGIPLLVPSFMYDGVHQLHHAKTRYGTAEDPEYLPLAWRSPLYLVWFLLHSVLAPLAVVLRFGILTPLSLLFPAVRRFNIERASSLLINPAFRRKPPRPQDVRTWWILELACFAWVWTFIGLVVSGVMPGRTALLAVAVAAGVALVNQTRTLAAHLWDNEHGEEMTIEEQLLDSVNVPGFSPWASLWAPVGLRYHALHHLLPGLPYHSLGPAHRRLVGVVPGASSYRRTFYDGLMHVLGILFRKSAERTAARKRRAVV
jgi:fatty acid desaturase